MLFLICIFFLVSVFDTTSLYFLSWSGLVWSGRFARFWFGWFGFVYKEGFYLFYFFSLG